MWEELTIAFNIIGGLALFMYGVTLLRETLGKISGKSVVRVLEKVSNNPVKGGRCWSYFDDSELEYHSSDIDWLCECRNDDFQAVSERNAWGRDRHNNHCSTCVL